jgi:hypothetical protein
VYFTKQSEGTTMRLDEALDQIADIRRRMAGTTVFRGYRSTTALFSAAVAAVVATAQAIWLPRPAEHVLAYLAMWCASALACCAAAAVAVTGQVRRSESALVQRELARSAVAQLLPSLVAGALLTVVLYLAAPASLWLLPGLWAILFGLGVLASRPLLPRAVEPVGLFYLLAGLASVAWSARHGPFSPWVMAVPFGVGQAAAAAVLYWTLERDPDGR